MAERKPTTRTDKKIQRAQAAATRRNLQTVTAGSTIRIEEPARTKKRRASKPKVVTLVGQTDDVLLDQASGFANFLREYGVVGLAIGFIAGQQANGVVKQMVASFVDPVVQVWFGQNLSGRVLHLHHGNKVVPLAWGQFVYLVLELLLVLVFVYAVVKLFKLDKLKKIDIVK